MPSLLSPDVGEWFITWLLIGGVHKNDAFDNKNPWTIRGPNKSTEVMWIARSDLWTRKEKDSTNRPCLRR